MSDSTVVHVGRMVPAFELDVYDPAAGDFGKFSFNPALSAGTDSGRWTVLVFYPADFTFVCPTELADLAVVQEQLKALGCDVIGVSTDTKFAHFAWLTSEKLLAGVKYPLAADTTGRISRLFGVYDDQSGLALRGTFVISPEGLLVSSEINFYNVGRNAAELLRKMEANAYLRLHPSEACPAKWTPGDKTLTPGKDLVGKVFEALQ
jgi:alkyl hydroperoxide reductase subunit AhpC